ARRRSEVHRRRLGPEEATAPTRGNRRRRRRSGGRCRCGRNRGRCRGRRGEGIRRGGEEVRRGGEETRSAQAHGQTRGEDRGPARSAQADGQAGGEDRRRTGGETRTGGEVRLVGFGRGRLGEAGREEGTGHDRFEVAGTVVQARRSGTGRT